VGRGAALRADDKRGLFWKDLIDQSQKMTVAAMQIADIKVSAQRP
jgi:hypothetical protein